MRFERCSRFHVMLRLLDIIFEFCASLKLAVIVILAISLILGVATFYEARYGIPPVQELVYGSRLFLGAMALLAINVMAAALIRYPWKRKQTGFVVTHLGILILLGGCLASYRLSVDGVLMLRPGDSAKDFALRTERFQIQHAGQTWSFPVNLWEEAGYPTLWEALTFRWGEPDWQGKQIKHELSSELSLEVLEWLPAAKAGTAGGFDIAHVKPINLQTASRAMRVAVTYQGIRTETWVELRAAPAIVPTPKGPIQLAYGFDAADLPFSIALVSTKRTNNPGTNDAAAFESVVMTTLADGSKPRTTISLNEPLTVGGYSFYQAAFTETPEGPISTLSIRKDPGTVLKYTGSALIGLGIFLMFYMKAYFQKPASHQPQSTGERAPEKAEVVGLAGGGA